jgi:hypothetical protein
MAAASSSNAAVATTAHEAINLRDPRIAVLLAWLVPGLGHWYQGRRAKAVLFFLCIFGTFAFGMYLGDGRVVYASWRPQDRRLPYVCQLAVGLPALPALVQANRFDDDALQLEVAERWQRKESLWTDWFEAPPFVFDRGLFEEDRSNRNPQARIRLETQLKILNTWNANQTPGALGIDDLSDELDLLNKRLHRYFEFGTVYTMVAGLLNVLVIFDAFSGPLILAGDRGRKT